MSQTPETVPFETARRVARNTVILLSSKFISKPVYLIYIFLIARHLGVEGFGRYSFCLTFAGFFMIIADFGLKTPLQRAITRERGKTSLYFINALLIKIVLAITTIAMYYGAVFLFGYDASYGNILYVALAIVIVDSGTQFLYNVFRAHEIMHYEALIGVIRLCLMLGITFVIIQAGYGLTAILLVMLGCVILALSVTAFIYRSRFSTGGGEFKWEIARDFLKMSVVFGVGSGFYTFYSKIDILMLERMVGQHAVGLYSAAYTLIENLEIIGVVYASAFMPFLFKVLSESKERAHRACERSIGYLFLVGFPIAIGLGLMSEEVITLLYGPDFFASSAALSILIWVVPMKYMFMILAVLIIALNREVAGIYTGLAGVIVNVLLNLWLIPILAHRGAAIATLCTELLLVLFQIYLVKRYAKEIPLPPGLWKLFLSNIVFAAAILVFRGYGLYVVVPAGALTYIAALYVTRYFTGEEKDFLREVFGGFNLR